MDFLLTLLFLSIILYLFSVKRTFDFFTLFGVFFIYYYSFVIGDIVDFKGFSYVDLVMDIPLWLKVFIFIFSISFLVTMVTFDFATKGREALFTSQRNVNEHEYCNILIVILFLLLMLLFMTTGNGLTQSKSDIKASSGAILAFIAGVQQICLFLSLRNKNKVGIYISILVMLMFIFIGSRANVLFSILIVIFYRYGGQHIRLLSIRRCFFASIAFFVLLFVLSIKIFYKDLKEFRFDRVMEKISTLDAGVVIDLFFVDPKSVIMNFITLVEKVDYKNNIVDLLFAPIPFIGEIYRSSISAKLANSSQLLKENYYDVDFGMASSSFGESFSYMGPIGLIIIPVILLIIISYASFRLKKQPSILFLCLIPSVLIFVIYFHRTALVTNLSIFKLPFMVYILVACILYLKRKSNYT
tara:strand:- start:4542 stop:5780 length:1239 start_codon:yes stop_codon:yes gene_type:complete